MTITALIVLIFLASIIVFTCGAAGYILSFSKKGITAGIITGIIISAVIAAGTYWYYQNTASGKRALIDERSELDNGLDRTITVYTADGEVIARYTGKIDIEGNAGGYVIFDYEGKRYTYYNCFVESIADIN